MVRGSIATLLVAALAVTAFAGKRERELMEKEAVPAIHAAEAKYKESCGCTLVIAVDAATQTSDEIRNVAHMANGVAEGVTKYCTDAASRKAMCQMKALMFAKGSASFTFKNGSGVATSNGQEYTPFDMMTRVIDK
jgi:hypothetical protein